VRFLEELKGEHDLIEKVLGSLRAYVELRAHGRGDPADAPVFVAFFRQYAAGYHHAREEDVLLPALVKDAELPEAKGPVPALIAQHHKIAEILREMAPLLGADLAEAAQRERLVGLATRYSHALWAHIDAENSVMIPESEKRLRRVGVLELDVRGPTPEEVSAREGGERLLMRYPPIEDHAAVRGEGCVVCPSYGVDCDGVEREWWNESEWEEFPDHL
jgi:hemerythrin-like domain-containing protein